jgi:hypothetical protein
VGSQSERERKKGKEEKRRKKERKKERKKKERKKETLRYSFYRASTYENRKLLFES